MTQNPEGSRPIIPADIESDFALTWKARQHRWAKKIGGKVFYFGMTDDPVDAHDHWMEFQASGTYVKPKGRRQGVTTAATTLSKTELAKALENIPGDTGDKHDPDDVHPMLKNTPLKRHPRGHHQCRVNGTPMTFPADPAKALEKYWDVVFQTGPSRIPKEGATIQRVWGTFMDHWDTMEAAGHKWGNRKSFYELTYQFLEDAFGPNRIWDSITQHEWSALYENVLLLRADKSSKVLKGTVNDRLVAIKSVAHWAAEKRKPPLIKPTDFPSEWKLYSTEMVHNEREARKEHWELDELRRIIAYSWDYPIHHVAVMLGINCGNGPKESASLVVDDHIEIDSDDRWWLTQPRWKTGKPRKILLWPETVAAIQRVNITLEDIANRNGFDLDRMVRVADITKWEGRSSSRPVYEALERMGAEILDRSHQGRVIGRDAARVMIRKYRPEPELGMVDFGRGVVVEISKLLLLTQNGLPLTRVDDNKGTGPKTVTSKVRKCALMQWINRAKPKCNITTGASFYKFRHSFQSYLYQCPAVIPNKVIEFQMGHVDAMEVQSYFRQRLINTETLTQISDHLRSTVIGDGEWLQRAA